MRKLLALVGAMLICIVLTGCGNTFGEIKEAASGINSKANDAASAISMDVHSIRATKIQYEDQTFTINEAFKTILRDVQWHYAKENEVDTITITGTWIDNGLFGDIHFDDETKKQLLENGKVSVFMPFRNLELDEQAITVSMKLHGEMVIDEQGKSPLHHLYDVYLQQ